LAGVNINDKYGFIDKTGKVVIEPKFNSVGDFKDLQVFTTMKKEKIWLY
jgi:hypothetical protein